MEKLDYKKEHSILYKQKKNRIDFVQVPVFKYLMISGEGNPNTTELYQKCLKALYTLSYTIKFYFKKKEVNAFDYVVMPLEGLWYADDMDVFLKEDKDQWKWTMMIMQPPDLDESVFTACRDLTGEKEVDLLDNVNMQELTEGLSAQVLHIGPYQEEGPVISQLHNYIHENGYEFNGDHHEIYLSDPRKSAPEKLKTIIRYPIKKKN